MVDEGLCGLKESRIDLLVTFLEEPTYPLVAAARRDLVLHDGQRGR